MSNIVLGIDIGATGIKGALVDTEKGCLVTERVRFLTPSTGEIAPMTEVIQTLKKTIGYEDGKPIGIGFPTLIRHGVICSKGNLNAEWIGLHVNTYFREVLQGETVVLNDADAAGIAEWTFGSIGKKEGTILFLTLGTGVGSALFRDGVMIPNLELGHLQYKKSLLEHYISNRTRKEKGYSLKKWAKKLDAGMAYLQYLFSPDEIILGGGISKKFDRFSPYFNQTTCLIQAATLGNDAGIIGAAYHAVQAIEKK